GDSGPPSASGPTVDGPPPAPAVAEGHTGAGAGDDAAGSGSTGSALPDVSTLPPALEAAAGSPARTAPAPRVSAAAPGDIRLASPAAAVGRGLRDDDVAGLYVALGATAALMALAGFLLP